MKKFLRILILLFCSFIHSQEISLKQIGIEIFPEERFKDSIVIRSSSLVIVTLKDSNKQKKGEYYIKPEKNFVIRTKSFKKGDYYLSISYRYGKRAFIKQITKY